MVRKYHSTADDLRNLEAHCLRTSRHVPTSGPTVRLATCTRTLDWPLPCTARGASAAVLPARKYSNCFAASGIGRPPGR
eukprot:scaffold653_cov379-Prasinococcus_capsulatus_cf.AAC.4